MTMVIASFHSKAKEFALLWIAHHPQWNSKTPGINFIKDLVG